MVIMFAKHPHINLTPQSPFSNFKLPLALGKLTYYYADYIVISEHPPRLRSRKPPSTPKILF